MSTQTYSGNPSDRASQAETVDVICAWPSQQLSAKSFRQQLSLGLTPVLRSKIWSVCRVCQRDGRLRFDVEAASSFVDAIIRRLRRNSRVFGRVRLNVVARKRRASRRVTPVSSALSQSSLPVAKGVQPQSPASLVTLNINSLAKKRSEVELMLMAENTLVAALQETLTPEWSFGARLNGFSVFGSRMNPSAPGVRGVCLAVRKPVPCSEIASSDFMSAVKCIVNGCEVIFCSVYVPCDAERTKRARRIALAQLKSFICRFQGRRLVVLGDFNMNAKDVSKINGVMSRLAISGYTFSSARMTTIDHVLVSPSAVSLLGDGEVDHGCVLSDHFPIIVKFAPASSPSDPPTLSPELAPLRLHNERVVSQKSAIASHQSFSDALASWDEATGVPLEARISSLYDSMNAGFRSACADLKLFRSCSGSQLMLPARIWNLLAEKRLLAKFLFAARFVESDEVFDKVIEEASRHFCVVARVCANFLRALRLRRWSSLVSQVAQASGPSQSKMFSLIRSLVGKGKAKLTPNPVISEDGSVKAAPTDIMGVWECHFASVFTERVPEEELVFSSSPSALDLSCLNGHVSWEETREALRCMKGGRAPGPSFIPIALLKLCLSSGRKDREPSNPLARIIFALISSIINNGVVPSRVSQAFIIPIPKNGSSMSVNEYRPISLMDSVLKLACHIMKRRLAPLLCKIMSFQQVGFRAGEECASNVAALREIIASRAQLGQGTCIAFLDFAKAFDSVPHALLLKVLENVGFSGRFLGFVKGLYANCSATVRLGEFVSRQLEFKRGVRQGCPLSPLLFNIFIEQLCASDAIRKFGVSLSCGVRVGCLAFADDIVLLSDSMAGLRNQITSVDIWCTRTTMSLNVSKCAVMCFEGESRCPSAPKQQVKSAFGVLPFQSMYKYLGVPFVGVNDTACARAILEDRLRKTRAAFFALQPALRLRDLPVSRRLCLVKSFLVPIASYGLEFLPLQSRSRLASLETFVSKAINVVVHGSARSRCSWLVLRRECDIAPLSARAIGCRMRLYSKLRYSCGVISKLYQDMQSGGASWLQASRIWLLKHNLLPIRGKAGEIGELCRDLEWGVMEDSDCSVSMKWYRSSQFNATKRYAGIKLRWKSCYSAVDTLMQMRCGSFLTVPRLRHFIPQLTNCVGRCPFCGLSGNESLPHLFLTCKSWSHAREAFISPAFKVLRRSAVKVERESECVQALLGGGKACATWTKKSGGTSVLESVIRFLAAVIPERRQFLFGRR